MERGDCGTMRIDIREGPSQSSVDKLTTPFGLLVLPSGVKSYVFQYRNTQRLDRRITIGKHGRVTPEQARDIAKELREAVAKGRDPLSEKREQLLVPTVAEMLDAYLASETFKEKAPSTQAIDRGRIERHLKPLLGRTQITTLTKEGVERAKTAIRDGKTALTMKTKPRGIARVRGGPVTSRDCIGLLRVVFNWAIETKRASFNPCVGVKLPPVGNRTAIIESAEEYSVLFETMARLEMEKKIRAPAADAIRVLALTGARKSEIANLKWEHVDLRTGRIVLPPQSHKTGHSTGQNRIITLPAVAQQLIAAQSTGETSDFVFRPARGKGAISLARPWMIVREAAGLSKKLGLHGLRHSVGSHLAMGGAQAAQIMEALGHRQMATTARYIHFAADARQALAERAASVAVAGLKASNDEKVPLIVMKPRP